MSADREHRSKVVVGVDGSKHAKAALEWAAAEAVRRGAVLHIVHALGLPLFVVTGGPVRAQPTHEMLKHSTSLLDEAQERAGQLQPGLETETVTASEEAPLALIHQGRSHDLLVLGARGLGTWASLFVGSVSVRVAAQAPCPVVVVPHDEQGRAPTTSLDRIVVGVDDSRNARRALGLAVELTAETGGELTVVNSWNMPHPYDYPPEMSGAGVRSLEEIFDEHSEELVGELIADALEGRDDKIEVSVVRTGTHPVDAVLRAADKADAIVVGSRGRGTIRGLLLGSVSQGILHRAHVPVVVLPKHGDED